MSHKRECSEHSGMCNRCDSHEARWFGKENGYEDLCDLCFKEDAYDWHYEQYLIAKDSWRKSRRRESKGELSHMLRNIMNIAAE